MDKSRTRIRSQLHGMLLFGDYQGCPFEIRYADEHKLTKILFPANWKVYPRIAGFLRNNDMLSIATHLIAFWDGKSSGTKHMIEIAQMKGIPVWVFEY